MPDPNLHVITHATEGDTMTTLTTLPPICPVDGPRPVGAGIPDYRGQSGWGEVQTLDGSWVPCLRCGDCGRVLLVDLRADHA